MHLAASIELTPARRAVGATIAALRIELPNHQVDPVAGVPITLTDSAPLREARGCAGGNGHTLPHLR